MMNNHATNVNIKFLRTESTNLDGITQLECLKRKSIRLVAVHRYNTTKSNKLIRVQQLKNLRFYHDSRDVGDNVLLMTL